MGLCLAVSATASLVSAGYALASSLTSVGLGGVGLEALAVAMPLESVWFGGSMFCHGEFGSFWFVAFWFGVFRIDGFWFGGFWFSGFRFGGNWVWMWAMSTEMATMMVTPSPTAPSTPCLSTFSLPSPSSHHYTGTSGDVNTEDGNKIGDQLEEIGPF